MSPPIDDNSRDPAPTISMKQGIHLGLSRITALLARLGDPHLTVPIIHVAGTNGKGSVCAYLESILRASGLRVGRFTSPHLVEPRDCIATSGGTIEKQTYRVAKAKVDSADQEGQIGSSSFELLTATAFQAFHDTRPPLDLAVVEVGLGGTTDATNVCPRPLASVITPIDMDHQALLGNTIAEIAAVKAGIIKQHVPVIIAEQPQPDATTVICDAAKSVKAPIYRAQPGRRSDSSGKALFELKDAHIEVTLPLNGEYQLSNAGTALKTIEVLHHDPEFRKGTSLTLTSIAQGLETASWPGRLDWIRLKNDRQILVDGAHNPGSILALRRYLDSLPPQPICFIAAVSAPRDPRSLLGPLLQDPAAKHRVIAVSFSAPEGMPWVKPQDVGAIATAARELQVLAETASSLEEAIDMAPSDSRVVICGSLYLVSDVYRLLQQSHGPAAETPASNVHYLASRSSDNPASI